MNRLFNIVLGHIFLVFASTANAEWVRLDCSRQKDGAIKNDVVEIDFNEKDNRVIWIATEAINVDFKPYVITYTVPKSVVGLEFPQIHRINRRIGNLNISDSKDVFFDQLQCTTVPYTNRKF